MHLWIQCILIRASRTQSSFDSSSGLIAVFHALHRLLAPRHPPHALSSLAALILPSTAAAKGITIHRLATLLPILADRLKSNDPTLSFLRLMQRNTAKRTRKRLA